MSEFFNPRSPLASIAAAESLDKNQHSCYQMLMAFASIGSDQQRAMYQLWGQHGEMMHCLPLEQLPEGARAIIEQAAEACPPAQNLCHDNAWRMAQEDDRIFIETGWAQSIIPMEHSWCSIEWEGVRYPFDPTDLFVFGGTSFKEHFSCDTVSADLAREWACLTGHSGPYLNEMSIIHLNLMTREEVEQRAARLRRAFDEEDSDDYLDQQGQDSGQESYSSAASNPHLAQALNKSKSSSKSSSNKTRPSSSAKSSETLKKQHKKSSKPSKSTASQDIALTPEALLEQERAALEQLKKEAAGLTSHDLGQAITKRNKSASSDSETPLPKGRRQKTSPSL